MENSVKKWFAAHNAYHKASETYNSRVKFLREQEKLGHVGVFNAHEEYKLLNDAQTQALKADEILYRALCFLIRETENAHQGLPSAGTDQSRLD